MDMVTQGITAADRDLYLKQGWLRVRGVVSGRSLESVRAAVDEAMSVVADDAWGGPWRSKFPDGKHFTLKTQHDLHKTSPACSAAATAQEWLDVVSVLLDCVKVQIVQSTAIMKPPKHGQAFPPHQDSAYYCQDEPQTLVALFHLDETTHENGALRYLSGSHTDGHREHLASGKKHLSEINLKDMVEVPAQAGDVLCANIHTIHGSYPNTSEAPRRVWRVVYQPA